MDFIVEISNLVSFLQKYIGKNVDNLLSELNIITKAKSKNYILSSALCSTYKGKDIFDAICIHENIHLKTIQLKDNGKPKEAMSFAPINFEKLINEKWENSVFKNYITGMFLFFVYKKDGICNYLKDIFLWKMNDDDLFVVEKTWQKTKELLLKGTVFKEIKSDGKVITNFPAEAETTICHVRPHGTNGTDLTPLPKQDIKTGYKYLSKQSFWFNHNYLYEIIQRREK